jgi:hypothetical protein
VSTTPNSWGAGFFITGGMVIAFGIINFLFLVEYPVEKGIVILE